MARALSPALGGALRPAGRLSAQTASPRAARQTQRTRESRNVAARNSLDLDGDPRGSSARANSTRRASWCGRRGPIRSIWRNGGGRTAFAPPPARSTFGRRRLALRHARARRPRLREPHHLRRDREAGAIVYHHGGGDDVEPVQFRTTVTFEDLGSKTRLTLHGVFPSAAERDRVIKEYGADKGLGADAGAARRLRGQRSRH